MPRVCVLCFDAHVGNECSGLIGPVLRGNPAVAEIQTNKFRIEMIHVMDAIRRKFALQLPQMQPEFDGLNQALVDEKKKPGIFSQEPLKWKARMKAIIRKIEDSVEQNKVMAFFKNLLVTDAVVRRELVRYFASQYVPEPRPAFDTPSPSRSQSPVRPEKSPSRSRSSSMEVDQTPEMIKLQPRILQLVDRLQTQEGYELIDTASWREIVRKLAASKYANFHSFTFDARQYLTQMKRDTGVAAVSKLRTYFMAALVELQEKGILPPLPRKSSSSSSEEPQPPPRLPSPPPSPEKEKLRFEVTMDEKNVLEETIEGENDEVLVEAANPVSVKDMKTLLETVYDKTTQKWAHQRLNDEIMNAYAHLVNCRDYLENTPGRKVHVFHSFFFSIMTTGGYNYEKVRKWTTRAGINALSLDKLLVVVNLSQVHWILAVINFEKKRFECYDSLGGLNKSVLRTLKRWLRDESKDKLDEEMDTSEWTYYQPGKVGIPQQTNDIDCGVFALQFADRIAVDQPFDFAQADVDELRYYIALCIMRGALSGTAVVVDDIAKSALTADQYNSANTLGTEFHNIALRWETNKNPEDKKLLFDMVQRGEPVRELYEGVDAEGKLSDLLKFSYWVGIQKWIARTEVARYMKLDRQREKLEKEMNILAAKQASLLYEWEEAEEVGKELLPLRKKHAAILKRLKEIQITATFRGYADMLP